MSDKVLRENALTIEMNFAVKTYDIDYARHVSNIVYLRWLEDMRLAMFEKYFSLEQCMGDGYTPVLVTTNIAYKKAIKLFDKVKGKMWITRSGNAGLSVEAEICVGEDLMAHSLQKIVFIDVVTSRPKRLPPLVASRLG